MLKKISRNRSQRLKTAIMFVFLIFFLILVAFTPLPSVSHDSSPLNLDKVNGRKFEISNDMFLKDGTLFRILGGDLHYFRVHPKYWEDRLLRAKALGLNTIQTYVPWNLHEPIQGQFVFDGFADIISFLELCKKLDLLVMLRPGPYICGEWDLGGFPPWLLAIEPAIKLRSSDRAFLDLVQKWWDILLPKVSPLLYSNGGPIIMVQIENEYGSYGNDKAYLHYLVTLARHHLGEDIILYTTDGGTRETLEKGTLRGDAVFSAVDFTTGDDPRPIFKLQKEFNAPGKSPPLSAEFYTGWLTHWGENTASTGATFTASSLEKILSMNGSAVLYMVHGGTNFGFYSGANTGANESDYKADITSYDYDAPIRESGDVDNTKYKEIRRVISKYSGKPLISIPPNNGKMAYGRIKLNQESFLYEVISPNYFANEVESENPISMEAIGQMFGFVVYASEYTSKGDGSKLVIPKVHDRAQVFLSCHEDREKKPAYVGVITRWSNSHVVLAVGNCGGPLISRLYFLHGGKRIWFSSWLLTGGWPINLIPLFFLYIRRRNLSRKTTTTTSVAKPTSLILMKPRVFISAAVIGVLTGLDDYLYAYGVAKLPVSTSSLIIATQLVFTALFAFLLVKQRFTSYTINSVVLLTLAAVVLGLHTSGDRPKGESGKDYAVGFGLTVAAAALYGLVLPLVEMMYQRAGQELSYALVVEIQLVMCFFATVFCTVGMIANKDFQGISREARAFDLGETTYYVVVVCSAIIWQCFFLGAIGVIYYASSLVSGILIAVLIPVTEVLAVIFYHEQFKSEKGLSLFLSLWGFISYFYGEIRLNQKLNKKKKMMLAHQEYDKTAENELALRINDS